MDGLEYVKMAGKQPVRFVGTKVATSELSLALREAGEALQRLEKIRYNLFPGNETALGFRKGEYENCSYLPAHFGNYEQGSKTILAILGIAKEAGKLVQELHLAIKTKSPHTTALMLSDSQSNLFFYQALISQVTCRSFEESQIESAKSFKVVV